MTTNIENTDDLAFAVRDADGITHLYTMTAELVEQAIWTRFEFGAPFKDAADRFHWANDQRRRGAAIVAVRCEVVGEVDLDKVTT